MKDEISGNKENLVRTVEFDKSENVTEPIGNVETLDTDGDGVIDTINRKNLHLFYRMELVI